MKRTTRPIRPVGQPTRGKTALNRLRQIDVYVALAIPHVLTQGSPLVVDLGFGAYAWTTLEMYQRWLPINPQIRMLGIEIDLERVAAALPYAQPPTIDFRLGGFNVDTVTGKNAVRLIRCYNVLRQYEESAVTGALEEMTEALEVGGVLIEGTSNPSGRLTAFDIYQKQESGLQHRALVFGTNFGGPVGPEDFQAILPKRLIHRMQDDKPQRFFEAWTGAYKIAKGLGKKGRGQWIAAGSLLSSKYHFRVDVRPRLLRRGFVTLYELLTD
jgi:hypothetical protein